MTGDSTQLINIKWKSAGYVTYGDNNRGKILGVGEIEGNGKAIIKDVLLVEGLKHSLLSFSQLCDKGFCSKLGIKHNFSAPRTPQQNGVVERKNRSLEELARTMHGNTSGQMLSAQQDMF